MKLLHISDLHIGKKLSRFSRIDDQKEVLAHIVDIASAERPQAVLIAGDVYDKATPSTEAVSLFDDFLVKLAALPDCEVFVISGNHDSPERIAFANRLIDMAGVHMSPVYAQAVEPFVLTDEHGPVNIYMLPFVKPVQVRHFFPESGVQTYTEAISFAIEQMGIDEAQRNVLLAHQTVMGSIRCDSEQNIGGVDDTGVEPYLPFDYVALGHIHSPQDVRKGHIRYCGSPLKYSFSECNQEKSVTVVELGEKGQVDVRTVPLSATYDLVRIEGTFDDICRTYGDEPLQDYVEVTLKDEVEVPDAKKRLECYFPRLVGMGYDNTRTREKREVSVVHDVRRRSAVEVFASLFEEMNNTALSTEQVEYLERIAREVEEDMQCGR